jgi:hypothetical protein
MRLVQKDPCGRPKRSRISSNAAQRVANHEGRFLELHAEQIDDEVRLALREHGLHLGQAGTLCGSPSTTVDSRAV